jgi:hypothetical protein
MICGTTRDDSCRVNVKPGCGLKITGNVVQFPEVATGFILVQRGAFVGVIFNSCATKPCSTLV